MQAWLFLVHQKYDASFRAGRIKTGTNLLSRSTKLELGFDSFDSPARRQGGRGRASRPGLCVTVGDTTLSATLSETAGLFAQDSVRSLLACLKNCMLRRDSTTGCARRSLISRSTLPSQCGSRVNNHSITSVRKHRCLHCHLQR
jgi:hypothetical protein